MPSFNFANVAVNRAICAVDFGGGNVLHVTYIPDKLTTKFLLEMSALEAGSDVTAQDKLSAQVTALLSLIDSWDAVEADAEGNEQPFPLDFDHLAALPLTNLATIFKAIAEDQAGEVSAPTVSAKAQP